MKLSVVMPAHNEQDNIEGTIRSLEPVIKSDFEIVVVDDHSGDKTREIVKQLALEYKNIRLVENTDPPGFANALKTGFKNTDRDLILPVMADLCDDPDTINKMYNKAQEGYDIICGSRYMRGGFRLGGSRLKGFLSRLGGESLYYILRIPTHDIANAFKMYRRNVIETIDIKGCGFEISMEIPLKAYYMGFRIIEVPTVWRERTKGKSSFNIFKILPSYLKLYLWGVYKSFTCKRRS